MKGGKASFQFNVQKQPVLKSSDEFLAKKLHLDARTEFPQDGKMSSGGTSTGSTDFCKKGSCSRWCS